MIKACTIHNNGNPHSALMCRFLHLPNPVETIIVHIHAMNDAARARPALIHFAGPWAVRPRNHHYAYPRQQHNGEICKQNPLVEGHLKDAVAGSAGHGLRRLPLRVEHSGKAMLARLKG